MKTFLPLFISLIFICGCGEKLPPGFEGLVPVSVTVVKNGEPVQGVVVSLVNDSTPGGMSINGETGANGTAKIQSGLGSIARSGAVAAKYKVVLAQSVTLPPELEKARSEILSKKPAEVAKLSAQIEKYEKDNCVVPNALKSAKTTSLEIDVDSRSGAELTIDLAKL